MILAIGDSNMYPACTESDQPIDQGNMVPAFGNIMHRPFRCWSKNGASNYWIQSHIEYFLHDNAWPTDTLLFVGWTSFEREEWPWLYNNISVCGGPDFGMPEPMKGRFDQWKTSLTGEYYRHMTQMWHDRIYDCHLKLQEHGIPHLFWTTYNNFKEIPNHHDWHGHFYKPYDTDGCMTKFFAGRGIHANAGDEFHYDQIAHRAWAQELALHVAGNLQ